MLLGAFKLPWGSLNLHQATAAGESASSVVLSSCSQAANDTANKRVSHIACHWHYLRSWKEVLFAF